MSKRKFLQEQIQELLTNQNVTKCSEKAVTYAKTFKILAVRRYNEEGLTSTEIFKQAGFNLNVLGTDTPWNCLRAWLKIFKTKGISGLATETRGKGGGRPKVKDLTDAQKIKRMELEIAYLKAENDFLAKLRAKRAE